MSEARARRCAEPPPGRLVRMMVVAALGAATLACGKNDAARDLPEPLSRPPTQVDDGASLALPAFSDPPREPGPARATQIAMGSVFGCARMSDDTMRCWGDNGWHQLGVDPNQHPQGAIATPPITDVVQVAAGQTFACARRRDRTVWCWGYDLYGELGKGDGATDHTPVQIAGIRDAVDLDAGDRGACAVRADGSVWCWGDNTYRQLGDGTDTKRVGPVRAQVDAVTSISVGLGACARRADGSLWCWGGTQGDRPGPVVVDQVLRASLGETACAVRATGQVLCWGHNDSGQLGRADPEDVKPAPVDGLAGATWVAAQRYHACAIASGVVHCWGHENTHPAFPPDCLRPTTHTGGAGALGGAVANWSYCPVPTPIPGIEEAIAVELTWDSGGCALTRDGAVHCWDDTSVRKLAL